MNKYVKGAVALLSTLVVQPCFASWQIVFSGGSFRPAASPPSAQWIQNGNIYSATNQEVYGPVTATISWVGPGTAPSSVTCLEEVSATQAFINNPPPGPAGSDVDSTMYWWIGNGLGNHCVNLGSSSPTTWACSSSGSRTTVHTTYPFTVTVNPYAVKTSLISPYPVNPYWITATQSNCTYKITLS